jgi:hypothetical protein
VINMVLDRYRDWRSQPPVTVVAGLPGSGKSVFLAEVVQRLAGSHSWYVPVPLDDVPGGGEQDILDAAQRQLDTILHDASINPGLIESLGRSLARSRRLMIVIDDIDRIGPALSSYERGIVVARLMSSAQQLDVPLLATARSGSVESIAGSVIELPPPSADFLMAVTAALRLDNAGGSVRVHSCLLAALDGSMPLPAAAHAAGLSLAIAYPPAGWDGARMDELARRLALVLADRVTASNGPAVGVAGLRDAVQALAAAEGPERESHLLTALHSSSFQVRLSVALALIRRGTWGLIESTVGTWIAEAESPDRTGIQHQLGLALWFCPYLATVDSSGRGDDLYLRGLRLAVRDDHNPLMFEISLARGFKIAAWGVPDLAVDGRAIGLLQLGLRFWYSRVCLVHAIGIRLASEAGKQATAEASLRGPAEDVIDAVAGTDPHPLVREAARITRDGLASGAEVTTFCWLAESDMGRSNYRLNDDAMRLLGDVSLLLNLVYCAEPWSEHGWRLLGMTSQLPACIRRPAHRQQYMTSGCPRDCPLGLCPYPSPSRRPRGRGELSAAFCQAQHDVAERLGPAPWHEGRSAQPQVDFWLFAEQHLANRDGWEINL